MGQFQGEKQLVRDFHAALDRADIDAIAAVMARYMAPDARWRGFHPFNEMTGPEAVATRFWTPLRQSLTRLQRRVDIFLAGRNEMDGFASVWVVSMGHLMGLLDAPWLGIAPTGKMAFLRYCEFNRIEDGRVVDTAMFFDIPHLMMQPGLQPFPPQTAAHLVQPGPLTHDGVMYDPQPEDEGKATLAVINAMISDLGTWALGLPLEDELARTWHNDMLWWGPAGIGATYTIPRYALQHSAPFRAGFAERSQTSHLARLAEGHYGGFFGWANLTVRNAGGFMGLPGTERPADMRVVDIYRRDGDKLAENWIFIDLLHFWKLMGVDYLGEE